MLCACHRVTSAELRCRSLQRKLESDHRRGMEPSTTAAIDGRRTTRTPVAFHREKNRVAPSTRFLRNESRELQHRVPLASARGRQWLTLERLPIFRLASSPAGNRIQVRLLVVRQLRSQVSAATGNRRWSTRPTAKLAARQRYLAQLSIAADTFRGSNTDVEDQS